MLLLFPRNRGSREPLYRRVDRAAAKINPFLIVIAIGLAVLDASCLIALLDTGSFVRQPAAAGSTLASCARLH